MSDRPVPVASFRLRREAEMAARLLANHGIPYVIQSGEGSGYGPMPSGATILVRPEHAEPARTVLQDAEMIEEPSDDA